MDSNDLSFSLAAIGAVRQSFDKGQPVVLQPIMTVEINVPEEYLVCGTWYVGWALATGVGGATHSRDTRTIITGQRYWRH